MSKLKQVTLHDYCYVCHTIIEIITLVPENTEYANILEYVNHAPKK